MDEPITQARLKELFSYSPETGVFTRLVTVNGNAKAGKKTHLGTFDTPEIAHEVYVSAKRQMHAGCTI